MKTLKKAWRILKGLLDELSDQSAYRRYLTARGTRHCAQEWRRFSDARMKRKYSNAKCC